MKDYFISYTQADRAWAEWIAWQLEAEGHTTVLQAWDFKAANNFVQEMHRATQESRHTVVVLSPAYLRSKFGAAEWQAAFVDDPSGEKRRVIPVRVRETRPGGLLQAIYHIDLVELSRKEARRRLLAEISGQRRKPDAEPDFPGGTGAEPAADDEPRFPAALPRIWNVPHRRNPYFTGREPQLARLAEVLGRHGQAAVTQAIQGLGGVGKTELATELCYRHHPDYELVWWLRSETAETLGGDYLALGRRLGVLGAEDMELERGVETVRRWLEGHGGWLLVFDNAEEPEALQSYLPRGGDGAVLITSRRRDWRDVAESLPLRTFEREESVEFLVGQGADEADPMEEDLADRLAEELGDLPLALEQAVAYVEESGMGVEEYLDLFRTRQADLLTRGAPDDRAVAVTWEISFERLRSASPAGAQLLEIAAFLAPDDIPLSLFSDGAELLEDPLATVAADPLALRDAVAAGKRLSLLETGDGTLSIHRLVQAVTKHDLEDDRLGRRAREAVALVNRAFPWKQDDPSTWPPSEILVPHAVPAIEAAVNAELGLEEVGTLSNEIALYLMHCRADLRKALHHQQRALDIAEKVFGPEHPKVAIRANNLGTIFKALGDLEQARTYTQRALNIDEKIFGPQHPNVAASANNLGQIFRDLGDLEQARTYTQRALDIGEKVFGTDHPNVAKFANNLGTIFWNLGDLEQARTHTQRALDIAEKVFGPDHPNVAIFANNLGQIFKDLGDLEQARAYTQRALDIDEKTFGPEHPNVAIRANNLGQIFKDLGDLEQARTYAQRALHIDEKIFGSEHPEVATDANNLGLILKEEGDYDVAAEWIGRALRIREDVYGPEHPSTKTAAANLAEVERLRKG